MKARFLALAALVLGMVSCQQDFDGAAQVGGEVDFQLSVAASELGKTRADLDGDEQNGHNSAYGAIDYFEADWASVDLRYTLEVYDALKEGETTYGDPVKKRMVKVVDSYQPVNFDLRLVAGRDYRFVVFADFVKQGATAEPTIEDQAELGLRHNIGADLRDITVKNDAINDEYADAYFVSETLTINNSQPQAVELKRPYAKVRVVATDLAELNLNVDPKSVVVTYDASHPTQFNAVTGSIKAEQTPVVFACVYDNAVSKYTAGYDAEYFEDIDTKEPRYTHKTLFTDYILAKDDQEPIHFTMSVYDNATERNENTLIKETKFNTEIPVQRNHLTTIIGNVLTTATEINVSINDDFEDVDGCHDINVVPVNTAKELQEALDAYKNGQTILFDANIKGDVTVDQVAGIDYVIDGNGYEYTGTITIDGNSRFNDAETVLIKNVNFVAAEDVAIYFIEQNSTDGAVRYAHNVTIEKCTFKGGENAVAARFRQCWNIKFIDCEVKAGHSLAQLYGCTNVAIEDTKVNALRGVSFGTSQNCSVKNSTFNVETYGVRADASVATNLNLENVNITAQFPVIARKYSNTDYAINFSGNNTLVAPGYQVIFTKSSDDAEVFEAPEVEFTVNGAEEFAVFPSEKKFAYNQASLQYFLNNTVVGENVIELAANIEGNVTVDQKEGHNVVINGHDFKYCGTISIDGNSRYTAETVAIKNINFVAAEDVAIDFIEQNSADGAVRYAHNVTIEECTFKGGENAVAVKFRQSHNIIVKNCEVLAGHSLAQFYGCENVAIEGTTVNALRGVSFGTSQNCSVKNSTFTVEKYGLRADGTVATDLNIENTTVTAAKPVIVRKNSADYRVNFTGVNTLGTTGYQVVFTTGDDEAAFVAPASYTVTGADNFVVFPRDAENNGIVYNATELAAALNNSAVSNIYLQEGEYGIVVAKSNKTIIGTPNAKVDAVVFNGSDNVTLKNLVFDAATAVMAYDGSGKTKQYANIMNDNNAGSNTPNKGASNIVIDGCTFAGAFANGGTSIAFTDQSRSGGFTGNVTIKNCVFDTVGGYYDIYGHYCGNSQNGFGNFVIEGNTFNSVRTQGLPVYLGRYASNVPVVVKDNAFNTVATLDNAVYVQDHSNYGVSVNASGNTFAN